MTNKSGYSIKEFTTGAGGDAGYNTEYALVDPDGNVLSYVNAITDDYGQPTGQFQIGDGSYTILDLDAINARAEKGAVPFGTGMGPALGYEYGMKNSSGDIFRKFDAQGNLTEYLDEHGKFQPASDFKPTGMQFNPSTGNLETTYKSPNSKRKDISESNATTVNRYAPTSGGWLGEGGWGNIARLVVAGLTANPALMASIGISSSVASAIGNVAIGIADGKNFGEALLDGVKSGAISAATSGILQGINADGVDNIAASWEDAANNGSFVDAAVNFSDNYIAPVIDSGGTFTGDAGITDSDMSFADLLDAVGISSDQGAAGLDTATEIGTKVGDTATTGGDQVTQTDTSVETAPVTPTTPTGIETLVNPPPPPGPPAGAAWLNQSTGVAPETVFKKSEPGPMYTPSKRSAPPPAVFVPPPGPIEPPVNEYIESGRYARDSRPKIYGAPGQDTSTFVMPTFATPAPELVIPPPKIADIPYKENVVENKPETAPIITPEPPAKELTKSDFFALLEANQAAGMSLDDALNDAISDFTLEFNTTEDDLLDFLGETRSTLTDAELENLATDLGGTTDTGVVDTVVDTGVVDTGVVDTGVVDTGVDTGVVDTGVVDTGVDTGVVDTGVTDTGTDDTEVVPVLPDTGTEEEEEDDEEKRRKSSDALYQMATATVKTPPPAEIDYFYDIGGDSVFATPKQESLMPSPFEEAPEAVEGAMPRYQYYDPMGGYQYADGGMVEDGYTLEDLYRILGSK